MSRSGYVAAEGFPEENLYRGCVVRAIRGKRGQRLLRELRAALEAMPKRELYPNAFEPAPGQFCALGALAAQKGIPTDGLVRPLYADDPDGEVECDNDEVARRFDIAESLAREIQWKNDEDAFRESPVQRWERVHRWVLRNIREEATR